MKIIEIRDEFIKIQADTDLPVSSFLVINDLGEKYIAQLVKSVKNVNTFTFIAKILYSYDGLLNKYNGSKIGLDAKITKFPVDIISESIEIKNPTVIGKNIIDSEFINVDKDNLTNKTLITFNKNQNLNTLLTNLKLDNNMIIIDTLGISTDNKYTAGEDFKLTLNTSALDFMYEECLNDATADSKNLIKEIFNDLSEYSKTVSFLPFGVLKTIVDDMVDKSFIFKLLVLKNKLAKYDKLKLFATTQDEANNIKNILSTTNPVLDLSKLDKSFLNKFIEMLYDEFSKLNITTPVLVLGSNLLNIKSLKAIIANDSISSSLATNYQFKYLKDIKPMFDNYIIETISENNLIFNEFSPLINSLPNNTYIVTGKCTNNLIFASNFENYTKEEIDAFIEMLQPVQQILPENIEQENIDDNTVIEEEDLNTIEQSIGIEEPQDYHTIAIEKKSDDLIERVNAEISSEKPLELNIFDENEEENEEGTDNSDEVVDDNDLLEELESDSQNEISDYVDEDTTVQEDETDTDNTFEDTEDFSQNFTTRVDPIQTIEVDNEIIDIAENIEEIEENEISEIITEETIEEEEEEEEEVIEVNTASEIEEQIEETESEIITEVEETSDIDEEQVETISIEENEFSEIVDDIEAPLEVEEITTLEEPVAEPFSDEIDTDIIEENTETLSENVTELEVLPLQENIEDDEFGEIIELDESELSENDIIVEIDDEIEDTSLDKEISEDVDKVFTSLKEETISDSDLDFIDELNNEEASSEEISLDENVEALEELSEDESDDAFLEPLEEISDSQKSNQTDNNEVLETRNNATPIIPVYDADIPQEDTVMSDPLEQGDTVYHSKYGTGVVEKMIKYGTKSLYSINFDNVGRRLLDPTLTEIKKA